jgi:predicted transcriptional regulator
VKGLARRNNLDICADILRVARSGARKTRIVYGANLNFKIVKKYLERLMSNELIRFSDGFYTTTGKGFEFLKNYEEIQSPMVM